VLQRIHHILIPPETIKFELKNGSLHATGWAPHQWITETRKRVAALPGIEKYSDTGVIDIDAQLKPPPTVFLKLDGRTLYAHGAAPHQWIKKTRSAIKATGGALNFRDDHLTDIELKELDRIKKRIEQQTIYFKAGLDEMIPGQQGIVANLVKDISELDTLANIVDKRLHIEITGHCDSTGTKEKNQEISLGRARVFLSILVSKGLESEQFTVRGAGSKEPLREEISEKAREVNRRVTFKVNIRKDKPLQ
jgi:OOP family OmpA-OmpF porin